ncbi:hypothetical protein AB0K67_38910 [Nonomuraea sp. NPDC052634]|uniref:hypothetical protein n=1 Tax=Nonomuraea sp. NPDC052634 TaxID=3155813 RepID=UPI003432CA9A
MCFVPLAPISGGVSQAVLAGLDIRDATTHVPERHHVDPVDRLVSALAGRELLLILDNCEHLIAETAELADHLLAACPGCACSRPAGRRWASRASRCCR